MTRNNLIQKLADRKLAPTEKNKTLCFSSARALCFSSARGPAPKK